MSGVSVSRSKRIFARSSQIVACVILAGTLWQLAWLVADVARFHASETIWVLVQAKLPIYVLCLIGSVALLRRTERGYKAFYAAALLMVNAAAMNHTSDKWTGWVVAHTQPAWVQAHAPYMIHVPLAFPHGIVLWIGLLVIGSVLTVTHLLHRESVPGVRRWRRFGLRSVLMLVALLAITLSVPLNTVRLHARAEAAVAVVERLGEGNSENALREYNLVMRHFPFTTAGTKAVASSSEILMESGRGEAAVNRLETLFPRCILLAESLESILIDPHHLAGETLTQYYEQRGRFARALHYARLAREEYPGLFMCYLGALSMNQRIERLEKLVAQSQPPNERFKNEDNDSPVVSAR